MKGSHAMEEKFLSLETLGQGAAVEMFNEELARVLENCLDPNTKATANRSVTLVFSIKPDEDRTYGPGKIDVTSKLAPRKGVGLPVYIGRKAGKAVATERDQRQMSFEDNISQMRLGGPNAV
jgi:hypothetical protein